MGFLSWQLCLVFLLSLSLSCQFLQAFPSSSLSFSFDSFSTKNLTLLGDGFLRGDGTLGLTRQTPVPATSVGRALYNLPIRLNNPSSSSSSSSFSSSVVSSPVSVAAFQTSFSFSVENPSPSLGGDGLAFIIAPDNSTLGATGRWLGLSNSTEKPSIADTKREKHTIAIEFDTFLDVPLMDMNDNHVGVDIDHAGGSMCAADLGLAGVDLKSGNVITAWIEYGGEELSVWVSYTGQKPESPSIRFNFSLSSYVEEYMYVGFTASTEGSQEQHSVYTWSWSSSVTDSTATAPATGAPTMASAPAPSPDFPPVSSPDFSMPASVRCHGFFCLGVAAFFGVSVGVALILAFVALSVAALVTKQGLLSLNLTTAFQQLPEDLIGRPRRFSYKELSVASAQFNPHRVVGHGAFGTVYKGFLPANCGGGVVAIKRSLGGSSQSKEEFLAELSIIGRLRHRNLVQLLGWCSERGEILLVYDYMPHGSLDKILFTSTSASLPWLHRYKVAAGVAAALVYLHEECEQQIVHRDVKASNIMLDADFNAKLGDFGLARLTDHNKSPDSTLTAGTMGYLAPEYIHTGKATDKTDVFSYGAVVLELVCGRRILEKDAGRPERDVLLDWVWGLHKGGRLAEAIDPKLLAGGGGGGGNNGDVDGGGGSKAVAVGQEVQEIVRLLHLGLLCCHPDPISRPSMRLAHRLLTTRLDEEEEEEGEGALPPLPPLPPFKPSPSFTRALLPSFTLHDILSDSLHGLARPLPLPLDPYP